MEKETLIVIIAIFFIILMGILSGIDDYHTSNIQKRSIEMNKAQFNPKTGNFEWLDNDVKYIFIGKR